MAPMGILKDLEGPSAMPVGHARTMPIARPVPANSQWRARAMPFPNSLRRDKTNGQMRGQCHSHAERLAMPSEPSHAEQATEAAKREGADGFQTVNR
jgi:hypothetical protein